MNPAVVFTFSAAWVALPGLPILLAFLLIMPQLRRVVLWAAPFAAVPALLFSLTVSPGIVMEVPWLLLGAQFAFGSLEQWFLLLSAVTWLVAGIYGRGYLTGRRSTTRFYTWFLLAMSGNFGLILAQDVVSFYFFFALMTYAAFGLVVHDRTQDSKRAGRVYITLAVLGEMFIFAGFAMMVAAAGGDLLPGEIVDGASPLALGLLVLGFSVKAGALPVHVWLPLAHPVAPTPASAVLSASMIKAGLLAWMRFLPVGGEDVLPLAIWGMSAGVAAAFFAAAVGLTQRNPKVVLAYSSISQMGLMTVAAGSAFLGPEAAGPALLAVGLYALHHALAKSALFLGVGMAESRLETPRIRTLVLLGLLIPAIALAGAPLTSGAVAKGALKAAIANGAAPWVGILEVLLSLAAVGTTLLLARFLWTLRARVGHREVVPHRRMWSAWGLNLLAVLLFVWLIPWEGMTDVREGVWKLGLTWTLLWPVLLGLLIAGGVIWFHRSRRVRVPGGIPAGDILALVEGVGTWGILRGLMVAQWLRGHFGRSLSLLTTGADRSRGWAVRLLESERYLANWNTGGLIFLLLMGIGFLLLLGG